jgi:toxin HigB-1
VAIKTFKHKRLKEFFETGSKAGIQAAHSNRIRRILDRLDAATEVRDMDAPGYDFHPLKG